MRIHLDEEQEVFQIANELGIERDLVVGKLHRMWGYADEHTTRGRIAQNNLRESDLDAIVSRAGFVRAMKNAGWLLEKDGYWIFPKFNKHNGVTAKQRALNSERQRRRRCRADVARQARQTRDQTEIKTEIRTTTIHGGCAHAVVDDCVVAELEKAGIKGPMIETVAAIPGITALAVYLVRTNIPIRIKNPAGYVINQLRSGKWPKPRPRDIAQLANAGFVESIDGHALVGAKVTQNDKAVYLQVGNDPALSIPADRLTYHTVKLRKL